MSSNTHNKNVNTTKSESDIKKRTTQTHVSNNAASQSEWVPMNPIMTLCVAKYQSSVLLYLEV